MDDRSLVMLVVVSMVGLFLSGVTGLDIAALLALVILSFLGPISPHQAFLGFSSEAVITMLGMFVVAAGLRHSGAAESFARLLLRYIGSSERAILAAVMFLGVSLSALMNNVAAVIILLPATAGIASASGLSPTRLLLPLTFSVVLGGTVTLIGTTANLLTNDVMRGMGLVPFSFSDYTIPGLVLAGSGVIYLLLVSPRLLPARVRAQRDGDRDLPALYKLDQRLFSARIPKRSPFHGRTLGEVHFAEDLSVQVVGVQHEGRTTLAPGAATRLAEGDVLLLEGLKEDLDALARLRGAGVLPLDPSSLPKTAASIEGAILQVPEGRVAGSTLRQLHFRGRYKVVVIGLACGDELFVHELIDEEIAAGDQLYVLGETEALDQLAQSGDFEIASRGVPIDQLVPGRLFAITISKSSPLDGCTVADTRLGELLGATVVGIARKEDTLLAVGGHEVIRQGNQLIVSAERSQIERLSQIGALEFGDAPRIKIESEQIGVFEVVVAPRSALVGKTISEAHFRERYGLQVLAIWRSGEPRHSKLTQVKLKEGDALLLLGERKQYERFAQDDDFILLSRPGAGRRTDFKIAAANFALLSVVLLSATDLVPVSLAATVGALITVLSGAISMDEAYRQVEWRVLVFVAAILPIGNAVVNSGLATDVSAFLSGVSSTVSPVVTLTLLAVISSLLSQLTDASVAVVSLAPVAIQVASDLGISNRPFIMAVSLASSLAFLLPFSHRAHLLVVSAGGYRQRDFLLIGGGLTIVTIIALIAIVPAVFPF